MGSKCIKGYYSLIESKAKIVDAEPTSPKWPETAKKYWVLEA